MGRPHILLLAGEESGDLHGAEVARALLSRWPDARLTGLGGYRMERQGVELLAGLDQLAVMGFAEVLRHLPFFWSLERRLKALLRAGNVDLVLPIDYPGLNLRIAGRAHSLGIPVLYYIAPQVWAWKAHRARQLARDADRIAVILPFEEEIFREAGGNAEFVGHPLLEAPEPIPDRQTFMEGLGMASERPILALFPGSRKQELRRHLELFLETGRSLQSHRPDVQIALARAPSVSPSEFSSTGVPWTEDSRALLSHATAALVKSGTTTLQAALAGTPFITVYRTHPLTFFLARRLVKVPHVALANLVAGSRVVPEVLQGDATPERLTTLLSPLLDRDSPSRIEIEVGLASVRLALEAPGGASEPGTPGASERVAEMAVELLDPRPEIPPPESRRKGGASP